MTAVMSALGFERFAIMGHDRGARVTYRLLLDDPGRVTRAVLLDIMSTADFWERLDRRHALRMYHWMFLAQAAPLPERLIDGDPRGYLEGRFKRGMATRPDWLDHHVFEDYRRAFDDPARRHATCEDYRAGSTCDVEHDLADRSAGRRITVPVRLLWGTRGNLADAADPLALWRPWCPSITGRAIDCGHFIPEEAPDALLADVMGWLAA
jgi:haloacetate dehalogenase